MKDCFKKNHLTLACRVQGLSPFRNTTNPAVKMSQNGDIFSLPELGIFSLKLGKEHTFCHLEHDHILVAKMGQKTGVIFHAFVDIC